MTVYRKNKACHAHISNLCICLYSKGNTHLNNHTCSCRQYWCMLICTVGFLSDLHMYVDHLSSYIHLSYWKNEKQILWLFDKGVEHVFKTISIWHASVITQSTRNIFFGIFQKFIKYGIFKLQKSLSILGNFEILWAQ